MTILDDLNRLRSGVPFQGDIRPYVAPTKEALDQLSLELRQNPSPDVRLQIAKTLVTLGIETDPVHYLRNRRILSILFYDGAITDDAAYRYSMDRIALLATPSVLREFAPAIARLVEESPVSDLFLIVAKAKAIEAMEAMQELEKDPDWAKDDNFRIAQAALGDESIEDEFIEPFVGSFDPKAKIELATPLAQIGTSRTLELLAREMRSPMVLRVPGSYEMSVRVEIAKALLYCHPDQTFLGRIESDDDYERIERWCEFQYGIQWNRPRPPFLTMRSLTG